MLQIPIDLFFVIDRNSNATSNWGLPNYVCTLPSLGLFLRFNEHDALESRPLYILGLGLAALFKVLKLQYITIQAI